MVCRIYLIRHAESEANVSVKGIIGGHGNSVGLTKKGVSQAKALGLYFLKNNIYFDSFFSSTALRTQQTAQICLEAMKLESTSITSDNSLLELTQGDWNGKKVDDIYQRTDVIEGLKKDCWNLIPGDKVKGESQAMVAKRMKTILRQIASASPNKTIAVFTHAYATKYFLADIMHLDKTTAYKIPIDNASVTIVRFENNSFSCEIKNFVADEE